MINVDTGVIQEDFLSHVLFNIVLCFVMSKLNAIDGGIERPSGNRLKDLDYVDNIYLFAKKKQEMKMMTELVIAEANTLGLKINIRKARIMRIRSSDNQCVIIDDTDLEEVEKITYLGCETRND